MNSKGLTVAVAVTVCLVAASAAPGVRGASPSLPRVVSNTAPTAWPDETTGPGGWTAYSAQGQPILDKTDNEDCSRGANPNGGHGAIDLSRGDTPYYPTVYWAHDPSGTVMYLRARVDGMPLTPAAEASGNGTGSNPWANFGWNLLIDIDGDGYKEFTVYLDGKSGGHPHSDIGSQRGERDGDDLKVYYNDDDTECVTPESVCHDQVVDPGDLVWWGNAATRSADVPADSSADGATWDFGRTRVVVHDSSSPWGRGVFIDFQFPLDALTDGFNDGQGGIPLVGPSTPMAFVVTTSASNVNPLQKDLGWNECFHPACGTRLPFGDVITPGGDDSQAPVVGPMTLSDMDCPNSATVRVSVNDAMETDDLTTVAPTIASVTFQYSVDGGSSWFDMAVLGNSLNPDTEGDLAPDGLTSSFNDWGVVWDTSGLPAGELLIRVIAVDEEGNTTTRVVGTYDVDTGGDCGEGRNVTWASYDDARHIHPADTFISDPPDIIFMHGTFRPATPYVVAFYDSHGDLVQSDPATALAGGDLDAQLGINLSSPIGDYHSVVYPEGTAPPPVYVPFTSGTGNPAVADDPFVVLPPFGLLRNGEVTRLCPQDPPNNAIFTGALWGLSSLDPSEDLELPYFPPGGWFPHQADDLLPNAPPLIFYEVDGISNDSLRVAKSGGEVLITYSY